MSGSLRGLVSVSAAPGPISATPSKTLSPAHLDMDFRDHLPMMPLAIETAAKTERALHPCAFQDDHPCNRMKDLGKRDLVLRENFMPDLSLLQQDLLLAGLARMQISGVNMRGRLYCTASVATSSSFHGRLRGMQAADAAREACRSVQVGAAPRVSNEYRQRSLTHARTPMSFVDNHC